MRKLFTYLLVVVLSLAGSSAVKAQFLYNQPITVTNNENKRIIRWQIPIYINTGAKVTAGEMKVDGSDIRFSKDCAGNKPLNYFIDSGMNSAKTKIWVLMDTLYPMADHIIYMRYGNPNANSASTYATFNGPYSSTDSVVPPKDNTISDCQRSAKFKPTRDIIVSAFGKLTPDGTTRWVTLFDFNTQAKLEQIQVAGSAAQYAYTNLANHMWLEANKDYIIALHNGTGDMYYYGAPAQASPYITYGDMRYCNNCNQNTFPTSVLANNMYGVPDFHYYTVDTPSVTQVPTYVLGGSGGGGNAEITLGNDPHLCSGDPQAIISYSATKGNPNEYDIIWDPSASSAGFTDVSGAPLQPDEIIINVPSNVGGAVYSGTLTVINACGPGSSYPIKINVNQPIQIDNGGQPEDTTVCPREVSSFTVGAIGPGLNYQWQVFDGSSWTNLANGADYSGVNSPELLILNSKNSFDSNQYRNHVTSSCVSSIFSNAGMLHVNVDPIVSSDPADVVTVPNTTVTFEVQNAGTARYQWQVATPGQRFVNINDGPIYSGVKTKRLKVVGVSRVQDGFEFRCLLYNIGQCNAQGDTSAIAILTVEPPQSISNVSGEGAVVLYPNPTGDNELFIRHNFSNTESLNYVITDKLGKTVAKGRLNKTGSTQVDITSLTVGMYLIDIKGQDNHTLSRSKFTKL